MINLKKALKEESQKEKVRLIEIQQKSEQLSIMRQKLDSQKSEISKISKIENLNQQNQLITCHWKDEKEERLF